MATKKTSSSNGSSTGTRKRNTTSTTGTSRKRKNAKSKQKNYTAWVSMGLFAVGLLMLVMLFVVGDAFWTQVRSFLFGVFGISFCFLGIILIYIAVLVAQKKDLLIPIFKILFGMITLTGTAILFSSFSMESIADGQLISAFYENGKSGIWSGGLLGAILGGPLLSFAGRPAANIIMIIFFICAIMLLTGITPAEIAEFCADNFGKAKSSSAAARDAYAVRAQHREEERKARREQAQAEKEELAKGEEIPTEKQTKHWFGLFSKQIENIGEPVNTNSKNQTQNEGVEVDSRAFFDVSLGPDNVKMHKGKSEPIEPVEVGPGGTFGLNPLTIPEPLKPQAIPAPSLNDIADVKVSTMPSNTENEVLKTAAEALDLVKLQPIENQENITEGDDGWISMSDEPDEEIAPLVLPGVSIPQTEIPAADALLPTGDEIENLVAAAMDKPIIAEKEAIETPIEEIIVKEYSAPPISLFEMPVDVQDFGVEKELKANAQKLVDTLDSFGVKTRVLDISRGPSVTRYELQPLAGVKISRITNLADDIALNLAVGGVRIEAPIPGKPAVGIEVPNRKSTPVNIRGLFESPNFTRMTSPLSFVLGKDIAGVPQVADLCKMPHLLVAGSTGSGKSVCVNSIIMSFLYRSGPEDLKLILIDPKVVELAEYNGIPHLLMPVVTEARKAAGALASATVEMERRYRLFADNNAKEIKSFNKLAEENPSLEKLPYIAIIIDELADLMMVAGKEVEEYICRIAQKARAAGMHLIVATQRPSVDVITGLIKTNIPSRISFAVSSQVDSRTILDGSGAEKLLGMGDMLFMPLGASKPIRIQGTYIKDGEINRALGFIKEGGSASYDEQMIAEMEKVAANPKQTGKGSADNKADNANGDFDPMLKQCAEVVIEAGQASTSLLQRRCKLGYARAARIMDEMEQMRIIGPYEGAKPRAVLINRQQWIEMNMNQNEASVQEES